MKILLLSPLPPPVGGIASWSENILEHYANKYDDLNEEIIHQNTAIKFRDITKVSTSSRLKSGIKEAWFIVKTFINNIKKHKPDVVHLTSSASFGLARDLLLASIARFYKVPVVIHFRLGSLPQITRLWEKKLLTNVAKRCAAIIVLDKSTNSFLQGLGFTNTYTVANPISKSLENQLLNNSGYTKEKFDAKKVVFVGHVIKTKGVFELVKACSLLDEVQELLIVGPYENDVKQELLELAAEKNKPSSWLTFAGSVDKQQVLMQMQQASVFALPSYTEGFPNVILEAMAMGCPIATTNVGAIPEMLDAGSNNAAGLVIEPKNALTLKEAIHDLLTDYDKAVLFSDRASEKVTANYTLNKVCSEYEKVWSKASNY